MPSIVFLPQNVSITVEPQDSLLKAARGGGVDIRFGCGAGRSGLCAVRILPQEDGRLCPLTVKERELFPTLTLPLDGTIRLACQTRLEEGTVHVDLTFQDEFDPADR